MESCTVRASRVTARGPALPYTRPTMVATARIATAFLGAVLGAAGCGDEPEDPPTGGEVWLGTGTTEYRELEEDEELPLIAGPQGGHHFIVHARMSGLLPGDPTMPGLIGNPSTSFTVESEDGERLDLNMAPYRLGYRDSEVEGAYELPSGRILQVQEERVAEMIGTRVLLRVDVTDVRGAVASDERWIVTGEELVPPPGGDGGQPDGGQ